ncbi:MAG TPA: hypothetical protein VL463_01625 [Kofleriaceae bacterium]|nr:hypothetical protein [Kofleriaceae bacterium]
MRGAFALVILSGCFGALGERGHRAPPGLAYCEPHAIELAISLRTMRLTCDPFGRVTIADGDYAATANREDAEALWDLIETTAPLRSCTRDDGRRFSLRFYGDDGVVEEAVCPLGADADFDRVLGAIMTIRHPPHVRWMDVLSRYMTPPRGFIDSPEAGRELRAPGGRPAERAGDDAAQGVLRERADRLDADGQLGDRLLLHARRSAARALVAASM